MARSLSTGGISSYCAEHRRQTFALWILAILLSLALASQLGDSLTTDVNFTGNPESSQVETLLEDRMRGPHPVTETIVVHSEVLTVDDSEFVDVIDSTIASLEAQPDQVAEVLDPLAAVESGVVPSAALISEDGRTVLIPVTFVGDSDEAEPFTDSYLSTIAAQGNSTVEVRTIGELSGNDAYLTIAENDLIKGELIGLAVAMVVLVLVFGALAAAALPLVLGVVAIIVAIGLTTIVGHVMDLSFFVVNMITMIGLAVGIDYSLFVIERYREERRRGRQKLDAIEVAGSTAAKAVTFSGGTVFLALIGMVMIPTVIFRSLGAGAVLVVIVAVVGTLTLIPALLALLGDRINWPRQNQYDSQTQGERLEEVKASQTGFWARITHIVMARPLISVVGSVALLVALAMPYFDIETGASSFETLPESDVKTAYLLIAADFPDGMLSPLEVVVDAPRTPEIDTSVQAMVEAIAGDSAFGPTDPVIWNEAQDLALISVPLSVEPNSTSAYAAIGRLRDDIGPSAFAGSSVDPLVGGEPTINVDFNAILDTWTPRVFVFVLGMSFLLLMLAFRSIVVPTKAILMNLLSVGAAYGLLVLVFQKGYGTDLLGFQQTSVIEAWIPIFLFCVLFGLSMDYQVFLLSRIREHYDLTHRNRESVAFGLQSTGRIITGAAAIMIAVFAGFATGQLVMFQQLGFGLAAAVFLDATVVRSVLVPAAMALLGDWNWYLPSWLSWLPDLRVEGEIYRPTEGGTESSG